MSYKTVGKFSEIFIYISGLVEALQTEMIYLSHPVACVVAKKRPNILSISNNSLVSFRVMLVLKDLVDLRDLLVLVVSLVAPALLVLLDLL